MRVDATWLSYFVNSCRFSQAYWESYSNLDCQITWINKKNICQSVIYSNPLMGNLCIAFVFLFLVPYYVDIWNDKNKWWRASYKQTSSSENSWWSQTSRSCWQVRVWPDIRYDLISIDITYQIWLVIRFGLISNFHWYHAESLK